MAKITRMQESQSEDESNQRTGGRQSKVYGRLDKSPKKRGFLCLVGVLVQIPV